MDSLKPAPIFSVIIPHLNQPQGLEKCLDSLAKQTLPRTLFEVIVVDNGSAVSIEPIVAKFPGMHALQELTPGPGPARNCGTRSAKGKTFAFIDADCRAHPEWLSVASQTVENADNGTILGGDVRIVNDSGYDPSGIEAYERIFGFRFKLYVEEHGYSGTGNLIVRKADFEKVGPFVGIAFAEDVEWGGRARRQGLTFRYVPNLIVYHPARNSIHELRVKWDRHISHELTAARLKPSWRLKWTLRAIAIAGSPFIDFVRPLTSGQANGLNSRLLAIRVLFNIRIYRAARMLASLFTSQKEILWNRSSSGNSLATITRVAQAGLVRVSDKTGSEKQNSPVINYALRGLKSCWLPSEERWSHIYHLDGRESANESLPESDIFYSLNVLLGLSRVSRIPHEIDIKSIFDANAANLARLPVQKYAFGMALWASAELGIQLPDVTIDRLRRLLANKNEWLWYTAQDLGMILAGVSAQAKANRQEWSPIADELFKFLIERFQCSSGLFFNNVLHLRRRFTSFATHTYLALACYIFGEVFGRSDAIETANACARKLIELQGPNGEWPWFFDTRRGLAVDFYEVYSVHQCGMAPAFLEHSELHGVAEARDALEKSVRWVLGQNQMKKMMLIPELGLTIRSQYRKGELDTKFFRIFRSIPSLASLREASLADPTELRLRLECRSYELGWILWSFGQRNDLMEFTHHPAFATATDIRSTNAFV